MLHLLALSLLCAQIGPAGNTVDPDNLTRFPSEQQVRCQRARNEAARNACRLEATWRAQHAFFWWETNLELRCADEPWELLEIARDKEHHLLYRAEKLRRLMEVIGPVRFERGYLPPAIPVELLSLFR